MLLAPAHDGHNMHSRRNHFNLRLPPDSVAPAAVSSSFLSPGTPSAQYRALLMGRSPPPSPGLPSRDPRRELKRWGSRIRVAKRLLLIICGVLAVTWWGATILFSYGTSSDELLPHGNYEMVEGNDLPEEPSAVMVVDKNGKSKWTISIPASLGFPLRPAQYVELCSQATEMSHHLAEEAKTIAKRHRGYYQLDPFYLDVLEAEKEGLLPAAQEENAESSEQKVCEKSLTYVMETSDAGMGKTVMGMWMAYGLAKHEGRAFFVDDTRWAYGNYTTYFQAAPLPGCLPPPTSRIVPCPHTARHIIISSATTQHSFGHEFNEYWEDPKKMKVQRQHKIFGLLRTGYEALFHLNADDAQYVQQRIASLYGPTTQAGGLSVAMHIRRGDLHPYEYQYSKDYLPIDRFLDSATSLITHYFDPSAPTSPPPSTPESIDALLATHHSQLILASDDAALYAAPELAPPTTVRAQSHIILATKSELLAAQHANQKGAPARKFIDDISGWEGGFYRNVFWNLGMPHVATVRPATSTSAPVVAAVHANDHDTPVPEGAMRLRELVGRSYLLDLAVLGQADAVVCGVSSTACRLLGVMVGWEGVGGREEGRWRNVDGKWAWKGVVW